MSQLAQTLYLGIDDTLRKKKSEPYFVSIWISIPMDIIIVSVSAITPLTNRRKGIAIEITNHVEVIE